MQLNFEGNEISIPKVPSSFVDLKNIIHNNWKLDAEKYNLAFKDQENELISLRHQNDFILMAEMMKESSISLQITQSKKILILINSLYYLLYIRI